jgi:hypothetical protein
MLPTLLRAGPALLADAVSYVISAVSLSTLHARKSRTSTGDAPPQPVADPPSAELRRGTRGQLMDGVQFVLCHAELRATTAYLGVNNVCNQAFLTGPIAYLEVDQRRPCGSWHTHPRGRA